MLLSEREDVKATDPIVKKQQLIGEYRATAEAKHKTLRKQVAAEAVGWLHALRLFTVLLQALQHFNKSVTKPPLCLLQLRLKLRRLKLSSQGPSELWHSAVIIMKSLRDASRSWSCQHKQLRTNFLNSLLCWRPIAQNYRLLLCLMRKWRLKLGKSPSSSWIPRSKSLTIK